MRLSLRLILSLAIGITVATFLFALAQVRVQKKNLQDELQKGAELLAGSVEENVGQLLAHGSRRDLEHAVDRFGNPQGLPAMAIYDRQGHVRAIPPGLARLLPNPPPIIAKVAAQNRSESSYLSLGRSKAYMYVVPFDQDNSVVGALAVVEDASYIDTQSAQIWRSAILRILIETILIAFITLLIVRWSVQGPIAKMAQWMRAQRSGKSSPRPEMPADLFQPLAREVTNFARSLAAARFSAEVEARLRAQSQSLWTPERLRIHVRDKLQGSSLFVVSNREPYIHMRRGGATELLIPASGLVTALEPVLLACQGTWIAHGSGDADREMVDANDRLRVPPDQPQYTLRRVWLDKEEEAGYYFGFANEGLWPLCHIAHTRPTFRAGDWDCYREVNRKFARAVLEEMEGAEDPFLLVQDYHFALLPRFIKAERPDARISIFWHIPWPNPQAFSICPWRRELLDGLLAADIVGFHVQSHCNYFLETADSSFESRIDWGNFSIDRNGHRTLVRPFPISVAFPEASPRRAEPSVYSQRVELFRKLGVEAAFLGVGVDRVDYTKGIVERFRAVERFLELCPRYCGQFTFLQIGAPTRTKIPRYAGFLQEVHEDAQRINSRFQTGKWKPIVFLAQHHGHREITEYYKAADVCLVTSLHDGMNLVSKEFVAARDDEEGALILSEFTGAAHELQDAIMVNPYDTDEVARAIALALEMDPEARRARMRRMRLRVREYNIYRWAASLIGALADVRLDPVMPRESRSAVVPLRVVPALREGQSGRSAGGQRASFRRDQG